MPVMGYVIEHVVSTIVVKTEIRVYYLYVCDPLKLLATNILCLHYPVFLNATVLDGIESITAVIACCSCNSRR